jgi:hypothetical protein
MACEDEWNENATEIPGIKDSSWAVKVTLNFVLKSVRYSSSTPNLLNGLMYLQNRHRLRNCKREKRL